VVKVQVVVAVARISQQEETGVGVVAVVVVLILEVGLEAGVDEEEDLVAQSFLQRTFLHRFLPDFRLKILSNLLQDSSQSKPGLIGRYVLDMVL
jgi:hypothetical protein